MALFLTLLDPSEIVINFESRIFKSLLFQIVIKFGVWCFFLKGYNLNIFFWKIISA